MEKQIKIEFIFGRIAELEGIKVDEDDFKKFVEYLTNSGNSEMTTEDQVYEYYGVGNKEDGKKTLRQLYVVNKAISFVVENANITVEPDTETEETTEQ